MAIDQVQHPKTLGRHTRLTVPYSWTIAGVPVDLEGGGFVVRVWVTDVDGTTVAGPFPTTVAGNVASYNMQYTDLENASPTTSGVVRLVAVAENEINTLVSDARAIRVGNWGGADEYEPIGD